MMRTCLILLAAFGVMLVAAAHAAPDADGPLTIERALAMAAASRPELAAAEADITAARERARQQGAWPNPSAFLELEGAPSDGDAWNDADRVVGLAQTLPLGGRLGASRAAARSLALGAEADRDLAARGVVASVREAFARALYARGVAALRDEIVEGSRRAAGIVALRRDNGDAADDEVAHARYELGVAELEAAGAEAELAAALADLAAAVGSGVLTPDDLAGDLGVPGDVPDLEALMLELESSPTMRAAVARAEAGESAATAASRSRLPDLGLSVGVRRFGGGGDAFDAGVSIDVPLFDRGGARTAAARADAAADAARVRLARLDLERRLRGLHARLAAADRAAEVLASELLPAADAVLAAAERRHAAGDAELFDLLQVRASWIARRLAEQDSRLELDLVRAELNALF